MESTAVGVLTYQKQPSAYWQIVFQPAVEGPGSYSMTDEAGYFHMRTGSRHGLTPGKYKVAVQPPAGVEMPEKYGNANTSGLEYEIVAGKNVINIDL